MPRRRSSPLPNRSASGAATTRRRAASSTAGIRTAARSCAGRILVMRAGRGSSSGSSVLAEAIRAGTAPAAIVLAERDAILAVGAMVAAELYGRPARSSWSRRRISPRSGRRRLVDRGYGGGALVRLEARRRRARHCHSRARRPYERRPSGTPGHDDTIARNAARPRRSSPRHRPHRCGDARPVDGARRDHRSADRGEARRRRPARPSAPGARRR